MERVYAIIQDSFNLPTREQIASALGLRPREIEEATDTFIDGVWLVPFGAVQQYALAHERVFTATAADGTKIVFQS